ncbi:MAG TPA: radical SAM family heme chaperone HemW [Ruminococcus sp.]|nr:radical SAM family heme chaperone HemW [Ruminococcus sp.]
MSSLGLYFHVPFCGRKCGYCDFYSVCYRKEQAELYIQAVLRNIRHYSDLSRCTDTVYFGGGTPSLLAPEQLRQILDEARDSFRLAENGEITLEANPSTLTLEKLQKLREIGINRLSIGVQSMNDEELSLLGRTHTAARAEKAVLEAAQAGFGNISCDLMIGLPGQTPQLLGRFIEKMAALPIQHISAYILKIEAGTPFDCDQIRGALPGEDAQSELYLKAVEMLEKLGFSQYEVSNFAKPGFESRHNCRYWKCLDYIGIGPSAHSCCGGKRFAADPDIQRFVESPVQPVTVTDEAPCGFEERAMLLLRLREGLLLSDFPEHRKAIERKLPPLIKAGYAETDGERICLTAKGFLMSNSVITYLIF